MMLASGSTISHFHILEKIGEGGMGVIYKARDQRLDRIVAIKTISSQAVVSDEHLRRFLQEARSTSSLNHPNIVTVYEVDTINELTFIAMEFIEGRTLREELRARKMNVLQAVRHAIAISD